MAINQPAIQAIKQQLTARKFEPYINILETVPSTHLSLEQFFIHQQDRWHEAISILQPQSRQAATIISATNDRVTRLNTVTNEVFEHVAVGTAEGWLKLLAILRQHIAPDTLQGYFIKSAKLVELLLAHPPQTIVHYLGYDSIQDCLDKEPLFEILAALRFAETEAWMTDHLERYAALSADDFEYRPVEFLLLAPEKWWGLAEPFATKKKHHFSHLKEAGVVFSYPGPQQLNNRHYLHVFIMMILHYIFEVKFYSNFFEHNVPRYSNFGRIFIEILEGDKNICAPDSYHLPIIQQYHLKKPDPNPCVFEPHVMPEVLHWHKARETFFKVLTDHPDYELLSFWNTCYNVGSFVDNQLITFNFADNILSQTRPLVYHFKEDLWNSLFIHYFNNTILEQAIIHGFAEKIINLKDVISTHYGTNRSK